MDNHLQRADEALRSLQALDTDEIEPEIPSSRGSPVRSTRWPPARRVPNRGVKPIVLQQDERRRGMGSGVLCILVLIYVVCVILLIVILAFAARGYSVATSCTYVD